MQQLAVEFKIRARAQVLSRRNASLALSLARSLAPCRRRRRMIHNRGRFGAIKRVENGSGR